MAVGRYQKWLEPENLLLLQGWKRDGLSDEQIAQKIGIAPRTLENWKKQHVQIMQCLKMGKEQANFIIENELFKKAKSGNVTAMIFYLKNNWREKYNDSQLSPDELKLAKARSRKTNAEADIAEYKVKVLSEAGASGVELVNKYLDKLDAAANEEVGGNNES
ncbi:small terminase subunit [Ligilactobacillus salivarius]|uniref:Small terminase subunit n=1 Tax=Ligilactobacillus salivarius TaxID=1624 RepID=A0AAX3X8R6_9LACO|nr:small terminase subunit [Ligilactobacillus salivarius]WII29180.1 small terminase subunit [Ligilactobacillus salivarius]